ncbi:CRISPR-associated protein Cas3 [Thiomicrospira aerophila AL3]|uniref:CRISPR-associated protein Cas3 n=1 Tax=Thiomicrospira aerophila AL3 TaxID=717772 RepID=W0DW44_9GAMM|nr:type I-F CRISPR-associated helicase Cas3f [Thiomicrospira aerophila]AHF01508.1 CRISPR-associated protein Cas3 [Thiomicrospira aerophila AL3]
MMVTFVSQCEKNALPKTRRILDSFANRIGSRTWQTVITDEGLSAVKKLLRKSATKSTAVSCHWLRSRSRSELIWVIGNRNKFNEEGIVPVNSTQQPIVNTEWENDWHLLPLIKSLAAIAALFHDWGKASEFFQSKLTAKSAKPIGDPLRHEWISVLFLRAYVNGQSDTQWLERLAKGEFDKAELLRSVAEDHATPLSDLPPVAASIAWLILSHHRLPQAEQFLGAELNEYQRLFQLIKLDWQYQNKYDDNEYKKNLSRCFDYPQGLPSDSTLWLKPAKKWAARLLSQEAVLLQTLETGAWRWLMQQSRLVLMLADHNYSSRDKDEKIQNQLQLYANTQKIKGKNQLKQSLEEHLLGVMKQTLHIAHHLPMFEAQSHQLGYVQDNRILKKKSPPAFAWQDKAVQKILAWREAETAQTTQFNPHQFGFFAVNMASTGQGKTFANAKVMRALSHDTKSLRYILALGLRTLTLQTGDEYRHKIGLQEDELAVLIGSRAVQLLHQQTQDTKQQQTDISGSESEAPLMDDEIIYDTPIPDSVLDTLFQTDKSIALLHAPVLACTIDHIMGATETSRGGRYILPSLRLMSSDLVIDEVDDFVGDDLIAIGRLVHLAGLSGRKVMISSATIPPDLAKGFFNAYQSGWAIFAKARQKSQKVSCAWIDEFTTQTQNFIEQDDLLVQFESAHNAFIEKRLKKLNQTPAKRRLKLVEMTVAQYEKQKLDSETETIHQFYFHQIQLAALAFHQCHSQREPETQKTISFGVVRVANIEPCIQLSRYLLNNAPKNTEIKVMAYHSRQLLIMRNAQEQLLDQLLKRNPDKPEQIFQHPIVQQHIKNSQAENIIFILVATPVEEVGRDHDFDWAIIEPSSLRSIIQMAGRVLRHRTVEKLNEPNIGVLQYNLKGFVQAIQAPQKRHPVFTRPGYEDEVCLLTSHNIADIIELNALNERLDATLRITRPQHLTPNAVLADLEHYKTQKALLPEQAGPETLKGWLQGFWWLTAIPQLYVQFRKGPPQTALYLTSDGKGGWSFKERNEAKELVDVEKRYDIQQQDDLSEQEKTNLWMLRDYAQLLKESPEHYMPLAAAIFGEVRLDKSLLENKALIYQPQLGFSKK